MNAYFKLGSYAAAFASGVFAMWLWHNASLNRIEAKDAKQDFAIVAEQRDTAINDGIQAGDNSGKYIEEIKSAKAENDTLRKQLSNGDVRLRLCSAETKTAGVQKSNATSAKDEAEANLARYQSDAIHLEERGREVDAWMNSAHQWINR